MEQFFRVTKKLKIMPFQADDPAAIAAAFFNGHIVLLEDSHIIIEGMAEGLGVLAKIRQTGFEPKGIAGAFKLMGFTFCQKF